MVIKTIVVARRRRRRDVITAVDDGGVVARLTLCQLQSLHLRLLNTDLQLLAVPAGATVAQPSRKVSQVHNNHDRRHRRKTIMAGVTGA